MDSYADIAALTAPSSIALSSLSSPDLSGDSLIVEATLGSPSNDDAVDTSGLSFADLYKGLSVTGQKLIDKLNEILKDKLPNGLQSLKPEEVTSEATAENIVRGATSFFSQYAKQNPNLSGEELLNSFMEQVRSGVQSGYDDAFKTLDGLGAFEFDGVKSGVEETKVLIETKLQAFETSMRKELGIDPSGTTSSVVEATKNGLISQAGGATLNLAA